MSWLHLLSYLCGGAVLTNGVPHLVSGMLGRAFQTPFASPPGKGLSSSIVNVLWGVANLVVGYLLVYHVGSFDLRAAGHVAALGLGALGVGVLLAWHFGRLHGSHPQGGQAQEGQVQNGGKLGHL